jgi:hypothetical protein
MDTFEGGGQGERVVAICSIGDISEFITSSCLLIAYFFIYFERKKYINEIGRRLSRK